eukprot:350567-Chlamydomonas_euryale.AAC.2
MDGIAVLWAGGSRAHTRACGGQQTDSGDGSIRTFRIYRTYGIYGRPSEAMYGTRTRMSAFQGCLAAAHGALSCAACAFRAASQQHLAPPAPSGLPRSSTWRAILRRLRAQSTSCSSTLLDSSCVTWPWPWWRTRSSQLCLPNWVWHCHLARNSGSVLDAEYSRVQAATRVERQTWAFYAIATDGWSSCGWGCSHD